MVAPVYPGLASTFVEYPSEAAWIEGGRSALGASEVWSVLSKKGIFETWARKVCPEKIGPVSHEQQVRWKIGHALEPMIADEYVETTKHEVVDPGKYTRWFHPDHPWLACTPDRLFRPTPGEGPFGVLELKTLPAILYHVLEDNDYSGWIDGGPRPYQAQLFAQMIVTGARFGALCGLCFDSRTRIVPHWYELDEVVAAWMFERLHSFWHDYVLPGRIPPDDFGTDAVDVVGRIFRKSEPGSVIVWDDVEDADLWDALQKAETESTAARKALKARLMAAAGEAEEIRAPDGRVLWSWRPDVNGNRRFTRTRGKGR